MKILNPEGWVSRAPDGLITWTGAAYERQACLKWAVAHFGSLFPPCSDEEWRAEWRRMYRKGWRIIRCRASK